MQRDATFLKQQTSNDIETQKTKKRYESQFKILSDNVLLSRSLQ